MPEKIEELVRAALAAAQEAGDLSAFELDDCAIERPADTSHGEWTSTMALKSAKLAHCAPRKIAEAIVAHMPEDPAIEKVEPGIRNSNLLPVKANGEVLLRSVRSLGKRGSTLTPMVISSAMLPL